MMYFALISLALSLRNNGETTVYSGLKLQGQLKKHYSTEREVTFQYGEMDSYEEILLVYDSPKCCRDEDIALFSEQ